MFSTINTILVFSIFVLIFYQPNRYRMAAAAIYATVMLSLELLYLAGVNRFETPPEALFYYGSAGLFSVGAMIVLIAMRHKTGMRHSLVTICLAATLANGAGFLLWYFYVSPVYYNAMITGIFLWAVLTLIKRDKQDVGDTRTSGHVRSIPGDNSPGYRAV